MIATKLTTTIELREHLRNTADARARIGLTNGCFDVLHPGHIWALQQASRRCNPLIVCLNSDWSILQLKGPGRPIHDQNARAYQLSALQCVDHVVIFNALDCHQEILILRPDIYFKSEEYEDNQNPDEALALKEIGAKINWLPRLPNYSTSNLVAQAERGEPTPFPPPPVCQIDGDPYGDRIFPPINFPAFGTNHGVTP